MSKNYANNLNRRYTELCNEYLVEFCKLYDRPVETDDVWVANKAGTIACVGDYFFDFHDVIKYSVDNQLADWDDLVKWYDYVLWAQEYNQATPNFTSWSKGCPRFSKAEQNHLIDLRKNFEDAIKDYKNKF